MPPSWAAASTAALALVASLAAARYSGASPEYMASRLAALANQICSSSRSSSSSSSRQMSSMSSAAAAAGGAASGGGEEEELSVFMLVGQSNMAGRGGE